MLTEIQQEMLASMNMQHWLGERKATISGDRRIGKSYLAEHIIKTAPRDLRMALVVDNQRIAHDTFLRLAHEIQPVKASVSQNTMNFFQLGTLKVVYNGDYMRGGTYDLIVVDSAYLHDYVLLPIMSPTGKVFCLYDGYPHWFEDGTKWIHR